MLVASILTLVAFGLAGLSAPDFNEVMSVTLDSAIAIFLAVCVFTITFGIAGVLGLWALRQPGLITWLLTGILAGAIAGILVGEFSARGVTRVLLLIFAGMGGAIFLLIRRLAGIQDEPDQT